MFAYTALQLGQTLAHGRYTVQLALSKGGMGAIYLATDHEAFDRTVVVKAMLDYFDPTNPQEIRIAREHFLHEARTLSTLRHPAIPQIYTYFQDGPHNYIVGVINDMPQVTLWRVSDGTQNGVIGRLDSPIDAAVFSPDGKTFATNSDTSISLWKNSSGALLWRANSGMNRNMGLVFSSDGKTLASIEYGRLKLWRTSDGSFLRNLALEDDGVQSIAFSPDGQSIAMGGSEYMARIWRLSDDTAAQAVPGNGEATTSLSFSPDGQVLVLGSASGVINVWRPNENTMRTLVGHDKLVRNIAFSPDGQVFASGSEDGSVILWRTAP